MVSDSDSWLIDKDNLIDAIYFNEREDHTLVFSEGAKGLVYVKEDNYVLVNQPQGEYLIHLTVQAKSAAAFLSLMKNIRLMII